MKIGIVSSGNETLALFKFLTRYEHAYLVYHDQMHFPFGTKDVDFVLTEIKKGIGFLRDQGAEQIIVDPLFELVLLQEEEGKDYIFPLFSTYLLQYCFAYSLVGKLGIFSDFATKDYVQQVLAQFEKQYQLSEAQQSVAKFSFPFQYRVKSAGPRTAGIAGLGVHNPYVIRTLKHDLRYFKDAYVDTLIPMSYQYFRMQRTLKAFFTFNKTRFHDLSVLESCFTSLSSTKESSYAVQVWTNQNPKFLLQEKELIRLMERGKQVPMLIEKFG